ncbi:hypothetical protein ACEQPO_21875 [Bacillus sp. SL00103]
MMSVATDYELKAKEGHAFAHYLFIEQSLRYTKKAASYSSSFQTICLKEKIAIQLKDFIKEHAYMNALIQFAGLHVQRQKARQKLVCDAKRKRKEEMETPKRMLFANLPSFSQKESMVQV